MRFKGIVAVLIVFLAFSLLLAGCGKAASRQIGEEATEKALEEATGGQAQVEFGKDGAVEVKTAEGTVSVGSDYEWPEKMPEDIPRLDEGKIVSVIESDPAQGPQTIFVGMENIPATALKAYKEKMEQEDWTIFMSTDTDSDFSAMAVKGKLNVALTFKSDGGGVFSGGLAYSEQ